MKRKTFNDDNALLDIFGRIFIAQSWPEHSDPVDGTIAEQLDVIIARIEDKLARSKNRTRHNWFSSALEFAQEARIAYQADDVERGRSLLGRCREYLESGNKAHRRKTTFLVAPDGAVHAAAQASTSSLDESRKRS